MADGYETTSVGAFVQQVAVHCLPHGYRYYVSGFMPEGKDYRAIDKRILAKYEIPPNRFARYRLKKAGKVVIRYLRFERWFLLIASDPWGQHRFFEDEVEIRDVQAVPIRFHGYELTFRDGRVWVRIGERELDIIRERFLRRAVRSRGVSKLEDEFQSLPYQPYRSVRYQLFGLLDEVNQLRKAAGLGCVSESAIPTRRTSYLAFRKN